jgi:hypothetical protein
MLQIGRYSALFGPSAFSTYPQGVFVASPLANFLVWSMLLSVWSLYRGKQHLGLYTQEATPQGQISTLQVR